MQLASERKTKSGRFFENVSANQAMWGGIIFSVFFTGLIWALDSRLEYIKLLPDTGAAWYEWKLPYPTFITRFSAWFSYTLHQVLFWGLIYLAQKKKLKYTKGLHPLNVAALAINAFFIFWHLSKRIFGMTV